MERSLPIPNFIALWLLPRPPAATFCRQIILRLAEQFDAPAFVPHLTVGVFDEPPSIKNILPDPIQLRPCGVFSSSLYTRTLFIRFEITPELQAFRHSLGLVGEYDPHLSLLYRDLPTETKTGLVTSLRLPFGIVEFDRLISVRCANPTRNRADVEAWRVLADGA